jgi:hypothetical protein
MRAGTYDEGDRWVVGRHKDGQLGGCTGRVGDLNGDGYADWAGGAALSDVIRPGAGAVYLMWGSSSGAVGENTADALIVGDTVDAGLCNVSAAGDVDGDGQADLLLGADHSMTDGVSSGAAFLLFGPLSDTIDLAKRGVRMAGEFEGDRAGSTVRGLGDVNGDGYDDLGVGAFDYPNGLGHGAVYVMLGAGR